MKCKLCFAVCRQRSVCSCLRHPWPNPFAWNPPPASACDWMNPPAAMKSPSRRPDWKFAGELGAPAKAADVSHGADRIGAYQEIHFSWPANAPVTGSIRVYEQRAVALFTLTCDQAADKWPAVFPRFTSFPGKTAPFQFRRKAFCPSAFQPRNQRHALAFVRRSRERRADFAGG